MRLEITDTRTLTDQKPDVRELQFRNIPVTLGSGSNNLVQLPDVHIASHHATLLPMGDHWVLEPTLRDGETRINGEPVTDKVEVRDGDVIDVRQFTLRVSLDAEIPLDASEVVTPGDLAKIKQHPLPPRSVIRRPDANVSLTPVRQKTLASWLMTLRDCTTLASLLETLVAGFLKEFSARVAWVGVRNDLNGDLEFIEGRNDQGVHFDEPPKLETFLYRCLLRHQYLAVPRTGDADTQSVLALPILSARGAVGLIYLDSRKHTRVFDEADLEYLTLAATLMAPLVEKFLSEGALVAQVNSPAPGAPASGPELIHRIRGKCRIETPPQWPTLHVAAFAKDGEESAGDLYDVMRLPNGLAAFLLAHVEADLTRVAAAVAEIHGAFRVAGLHADPPHVQLKALNWLLFDEADPCRADIAVLVINPKTGAMEVASAGKMGVLLIDPGGQPKRLGPPPSPSLGIAKNTEYAGVPGRLDEGHMLALFTRGCTRACNDAGQPIGEKRFLTALCASAGESAAVALEDLLADTADFFRAGRTPDDVTVLLAHRPGS